MPSTWAGRVHGVGVRVISEDKPFADLVEATYHYFGAPDVSSPDIVTEFSYVVGRSRVQPTHSGLPWRLGAGIHSDGAAKLAYLDRRGTFVHFDGSLPQWRIRAVHTESVVQTAARLLRVRPTVHTGNRQIAMRLAVHYPVFWRLTGNGIFPLHASTVARDGRALVFAGLNGCGKSTLALTLCRSHGFKLVADNFTLHDGRRVLPFPETLRLAQAGIAGLPIQRVSRSPVFGKHQFVPANDLVSGEAEVAAIFCTVLDPQLDTTCIAEMDPDEADLWLEAAHDFLRELPQHSYLRMLSAGRDHQFPLAAARAAQRRLLDGCRVFLLRISTEAPPAESAEQVLQCF